MYHVVPRGPDVNFSGNYNQVAILSSDFVALAILEELYIQFRELKSVRLSKIFN